MPEKLLYLDIDMMAAKDIAELYNTNIKEYEYAAVKEKYGSKIIRPDYINAGMLLLNLNKIKETGLLEKARALIKKRKLPLQTKMLFSGVLLANFYYQENSMSRQALEDKIR